MGGKKKAGKKGKGKGKKDDEEDISVDLFYRNYKKNCNELGCEFSKIIKDKYDNDVYVLPKHLDEKVARLHLQRIGANLTSLSNEQAAYIGVEVEGPYKPEHYRY